MYTGKTNGRNGVGVISDEAMKAKVVEVIKKIDWIIVIKLVLEASIVSAINMYSSQSGCTDDMKNAFWRDINHVPENEKIIIIG